MLETLREDLRAATDGPPSLRAFLRAYLMNMGFRAVVYFRCANWLVRHRVKYLPMLVSARCVRVTGAEIVPLADIGPGFVVRHAGGVVIGKGARIGRNCTIMQNVTLGERYSARDGHRYPTLGNGVTVGAGAVLLGSIQVGDGAMIGANSVVLDDVPAGSLVVGAPARVAKRRVVSAASRG